MKLNVCSKLCSECPFSTNAPKGWLGSHSLGGVLAAQNDEKLFSCHLARRENMTGDDIESGQIKICRGYVASATKSGIVFGEDEINGPELQRLQQLISAENKEDVNIILSQEEFVVHHAHAKPDVTKILNISKEEFLRRQGFVAAPQSTGS